MLETDGAQAVLQALQEKPSSQLVEFAGNVNIIVGILRLCRDKVWGAEWAEKVDKMLEQFKKYTDSFPIFAPRALCLQATREAVFGEGGEASVGMLKSAALASDEYLGMGYERDYIEKIAEEFGLGAGVLETAKRTNRRASARRGSLFKAVEGGGGGRRSAGLRWRW